MKAIHVVELERTQFDNVIFVGVFSHLEGQTATYIASQTGINACRFKNMVYQRSSCRFAVAAGNTNHF